MIAKDEEEQRSQQARRKCLKVKLTLAFGSRSLRKRRRCKTLHEGSTDLRNEEHSESRQIRLHGLPGENDHC